jgi:DNA-binding LytR/AlgR family response regulator
MIHCLIVEDEPLAADVLSDYIRQLPYLKLVKVCPDAIYALEVLQQENIHLLFLDIHLPGLKGLDFLKSLTNPPQVILTTAFHQYALQGYELNVVDYLLKPIEFQRFLSAVNKVHSGVASTTRPATITVQSDKKKVVIPVEEILFIESQKEYIKIQTTTTHHITKCALTKIEEELDPTIFLRVHRSFIIAMPKVRSYSSHEIDVGGRPVPIGGNYRDAVNQSLVNYFQST